MRVYYNRCMSEEIEVKKDTESGELYIELPEEVMDRLGWKTGDDLRFTEQADGSIFVKRVKLETVELELDEQELNRYLLAAHERGQSFDRFVEDAIKHALEHQPESKKN